MNPGTGIRSVADFWNARPCNVRHSDLEIGTREYFDAVERRRYFVEPHVPKFAQLERWEGKRVLEVGCGIGTESVNFARAGAHLTCVELSERSLEICKQRFDVYGLSADFVLANVEELDKHLEPQPFDLVFSFGVLHHTPNPAAALACLRQYLAPGSELRIMLYSRWSWKAIGIWLQHGHEYGWSLDEAVPAFSEAQSGCPITHVYSFEQIRGLLSSAGYKVTQMWKGHIFPYQVDQYIRYEYVREWYFRVMPRWLYQKLCRVLGWHTMVVAKLKS